MSRVKPSRIVDLSKEIAYNRNDPFFMRVKIRHHPHWKAAIHEMPLDLCFGPGVKFDMRHKADGEEITVVDMEASLKASGATLEKGAIALIHTGRDRYQGSKDYWKRGAGVSGPATEWLIDQGVCVMGVDQWGWDSPFYAQIAKSKETNDRTLFWQGHLVGRRKPYWQMEQAWAGPAPEPWLRCRRVSAPPQARLRRPGARRRISLLKRAASPISSRSMTCRRCRVVVIEACESRTTRSHGGSRELCRAGVPQTSVAPDDLLAPHHTVDCQVRSLVGGLAGETVWAMAGTI